MRIAVDSTGIEANQLQQSPRRGQRRLPARAIVHGSFDDRIAHGAPRIERAVGILKNDLHPATQRPQGTRAELGDINAVELDCAGGRLDQPRDAPGDRRFARTRFTDDAQRFATADVQRNVDGCGDFPATAPPAAARIGLGETACRDDGGRIACQNTMSRAQARHRRDEHLRVLVAR